MILVILVVTILLAMLCHWMYDNSCNFEGFFETGCIIFIIAAIVETVITGLLLFGVIDSIKVDDIIVMYQEENTAIETQMNDLVSQYMEYEHDTYKEFAPESSITLVSMYPELKSDELVKSQIEVYLANNEKIKELKEMKIKRSVYKWWLYFGKDTKENETIKEIRGI